MAFCNHCGHPIESEAAQFCPRCGAPRKQSPGYAPMAPNNPPSNPPYSPYPPAPPAPQLGMKWFKFLIYFSLFAGAAVDFVNCVLYLTGGMYSIYGVSPREMYAAFPGLQAVDVVAGILSAGIAGFSIYTRFRLAGFRANAPLCLTILYAAGIAFSLIYTLASHAVTQWNADAASDVIVSVMPTFAVLCVNQGYFKKRQSLFCN